MNELTLKEIIVTPEQVELIKKTIADGATDAELKLFIHDCKRRGVHPLDRLIHFTKRKGKYVPIVGIDYLRSRADMTGEYAGSDNYGFEGEPGKDNFAATATVHRFICGQKVPFTATARYTEYYPGDDVGFMWKKMPHNQLGKCAEALALRKAFPQDLGGLYTEEEMEQANNIAPPPLEPKRKSEIPPATEQPQAGPPDRLAGPPDRLAGPPDRLAGPPDRLAGPPDRLAGPRQDQAQNKSAVYEMTESHKKLWDALMERTGGELTEAGNVLQALTQWTDVQGNVHKGKRELRYISEKMAQIGLEKILKPEKAPLGTKERPA